MLMHILEETLLNSILITGLVTIMMMMIESLNIESRGRFFDGLRHSRVGSVLTGALLGVIPGCMGGFATVSLYTHRMLPLGALIAMMIASSGDEAFVMMAAIPQDALWIFALLFGIAVAVGLITDIVVRKDPASRCPEHYELHAEDQEEQHHNSRSLGWKRVVMFIGVALFIVALGTGHLEHEHEHEEIAGGFNLLSEEWMNIMFAILSIVVLVILVRASDHFVNEHLWHHVVAGHVPSIFAWTAGVLVTIGLLLNYCDISAWISDNTVLMILLATLVGVIPESGPHMIFVTLYASGIVPLPVLLASCISQDGHASLPLLAESKISFAWAKLINCTVAIAVGLIAMLF